MVTAVIILTKSNVSLHVFLPPELEVTDVDLPVTHDRNGLKNRVFMLRVGAWASKSALSVRDGLVLKYAEQSATSM